LFPFQFTKYTTDGKSRGQLLPTSGVSLGYTFSYFKWQLHSIQHVLLSEFVVLRHVSFMQVVATLLRTLQTTLLKMQHRTLTPSLSNIKYRYYTKSSIILFHGSTHWQMGIRPCSGTKTYSSASHFLFLLLNILHNAKTTHESKLPAWVLRQHIHNANTFACDVYTRTWRVSRINVWVDGRLSSIVTAWGNLTVATVKRFMFPLKLRHSLGYETVKAYS
jgi:hypothetical protein